MIRTLVLVLLVLLSAENALHAQSTDVLGMHDLSVGGKSPVQLPGNLGCTFCHAPHSGMTGTSALWNQKLSTQTYSPYTSTTFHQVGKQPIAGDSTSLCLSCHDGTVAVGQSVAYGKAQSAGKMYTYDVLGTEMQNSHPFSMKLPLNDAPDLSETLASGKTADTTGAVKLIFGNVECKSCHNPHVQSIDRNDQRFLVLDNTYSRLCLACHDPKRVVSGKVNLLSGWAESSHALASNEPAVDAHVGPYGMVGKNACLTCHMPHNAQGKRLLRPANPSAPSLDAVTQSCITCHASSSNITPAAPNIAGELSKTSHPLPGGSTASTHDAAEPVVLDNNRHATCTDCHSPHASQKVSDYPAPPVIRGSQINVVGVNPTDGTILDVASNQYENCLRCHGASAGKQSPTAFGYMPIRVVAASDALNVIPEFITGSSSSHPVMHDRSSKLIQPSLLTYMRDIDQTKDMRAVGARILCTDCHNSDDNREFGRSGPNGPHGSIYPHILERQYKYNTIADGAAPGTAITTLYTPVDLSSTGPYALCAKCHNLNIIMSDVSFSKHSYHISQGFACSVCHTPHGMGSTNANVSGERMVNFDAKVVGQNGTAPISYDRTTSSCTLTCHQHKHSGTGASTN